MKRSRNLPGENVKAALKMAIEMIHSRYPGHVCTTLVADGGSENHAVTVTELLEATEHPCITKIIALKDIVFSNSPVEAINKIMKRYLRHHQPSTERALRKCIEFAVDDYNSIRPHHSLQGAIPMESYTNSIPGMDFSRASAKAKAARIAENRKASCGNCEIDQ